VFVCDAAFRIEPSFYIGPDNGMTQLEWETANVRLPPLDLPRQFADQVATAELVGREDALIGYYRRLVEIAERHGKAASLQPFPYLRIQPTIIANAEVLTDFSWNDDIHETQSVLEMLAESGIGPPRMVHGDEDQGWRILIAATEAEICFIEWDAEGPPPSVRGYAVDSAALAWQAGAALDRLRIIHHRLVRAFGRDYWTYRPSPPPVPPTNRRKHSTRLALLRLGNWFYASSPTSHSADLILGMRLPAELGSIETTIFRLSGPALTWRGKSPL
jgi:hypothetical protein